MCGNLKSPYRYQLIVNRKQHVPLTTAVMVAVVLVEREIWIRRNSGQTSSCGHGQRVKYVVVYIFTNQCISNQRRPLVKGQL